MKRQWILAALGITVLAVALVIFGGRGARAGVPAAPAAESVRAPLAPAATIVVTSTADSGAGTLRQALLDAANGDIINFDTGVFPPGNPQTITLTSALPDIITDNLTIDASNAGVIIDGSGVSEGDGLHITSDRNTIKGLQIIGFPDDGVEIANGAKHNTIGGDWTVGSAPRGEGNVITLNKNHGVNINGTGTMSNTVSGNLIGLDLDGTRDIRVQAMAISPDYASDQTLFIGTKFHGVWQTTDGGNNWAMASSGLTISNVLSLVISPDYAADGTIFAGTAEGGIFKSTNWGSSWTRVDGGVTGADIRALVISPDYANDSTTFAGTGDGIFASTDAGNNWEVRNSGLTSWGIEALAISPNFAADETIFVGTWDAEVFRSTDQGFNWTDVSGDWTQEGVTALAISPNYANDQTIFAATSFGDDPCGEVFKSINGGDSWNSVGGDPGWCVIFALAVSPNYAVDQTLFVGDEWSGIYRSTNGGINWVQTLTGYRHRAIAISPGYASDQTLFLSTIADGVLKSVDGGSTWTEVNAGLTKRGNYEHGVSISDGAQWNTVGGDTADERNVISNNSGDGVSISGSATMSNTVSGNYIGTDAAGSATLGNGLDGVMIGGGAQRSMVGGTTTGERNVISGNGHRGVEINGIETTYNIVIGNFIGTDASGMVALEDNGGSGVWLCWGAQYNRIGGTTAGERNVISGNDGNGVQIEGPGTDHNIVTGNYIGTDASGGTALGNNNDGVAIWDARYNVIGGSTSGERNVISGNDGNGVQIEGPDADHNVVVGNYIGTDASGGTALGNNNDGVAIWDARYNVIGGSTSGERNVISGNGSLGVAIGGSSAMSNTVIGNYIGTDASGTVALGNGDGTGGPGGILIHTDPPDEGPSYNIIGGSTAGERNVISGNQGHGVQMCGNYNVIAGNFIGTDVSGVLPLGNRDQGVNVCCGSAQYNVIGHGNVIAYSTHSGVWIGGGGGNTLGNTITRNSIHSNADKGIELVYGGNAELMAPVFTNFDLGAGTATGTACANCTVEIFSDSSDEGEIYEGSTTADGAGDWVFSKGAPFAGPHLTATATDGAGNTSEFSVRTSGACTVTSTADGGSGTLRDCLLDTQAGDTITFDPAVFPPGSPVTIALTSGLLPGITPGNVTIDASNAGGILDGSVLGTVPETVLMDDISLTLDSGPNIILNSDFSEGLAHWPFHDSAPGVTRTISTDDFHSAPSALAQTTLASVGENAITYDPTGVSGPLPGWPYYPGSSVWITVTSGVTVKVRLWYRGGGIHIGLQALFQNGETDPIGQWWFPPEAGWAEASATVMVPPNTKSIALDLGHQHSLAGPGLHVASDGNTIRGLQILNFPTGVQVSGDHNHIGGRNASPGGACTGDCNVISQSGQFGIIVGGESNTISGNYIGTDRSGTVAAGNLYGVWITSPNNIIGGSWENGEGNLISGSARAGLTLVGAGASGNIVCGNHIGTDTSGTFALPNRGGGISINSGAIANRIGGDTPGDRNLISGNDNIGVDLTGSNTTSNTVSGNYIGTDISGMAVISNAGNGVYIGNGASTNLIGGNNATPGGVCSGECNLISGNGESGVWIQGTWVGLDAFPDLTGLTPDYTGTFPVISFPTTSDAFASADGITPTTVSGDQFYDFFAARFTGLLHVSVSGEYTFTLGSDDGSLLYIDGNLVIDRNYLTGYSTSQTTLNLAAGSYPIEIDFFENYGAAGLALEISGPATTNLTTDGGVPGLAGEFFQFEGILHSASHNVVSGNYIGTDVGGSYDISNTWEGIVLVYGAQHNVVGGNTAGERNVVGANSYGVVIWGDETDQNTISGNYIGTDVSGNGALGNGYQGIYIGGGAQQNIVGPGNTVAYNGDTGVIIIGTATLSNTVTSNSIHSNAGKGIKLTDGGNRELAPPVITRLAGGDTITGTACAGCAVEIFSDDAEEGRLYEGTATADGSGQFSFNKPGGFTGPNVTATATDPAGNTSEFSVPLVLAPPSISHIVPNQGTNDVPCEINIYGLNFAEGVSVTLGTTPPTGLATWRFSSSHLRATVPAGLPPGTYDLTVTNPDGGSDTLASAYSVFDAQAENDDLYAQSHDLWSEPPSIRQGEQANLGLVVHRQGGKATLFNVIVRFYDGNPDSGGTLIGDGTIYLLSPRSSESTTRVPWSPAAAGDYTIYARIDPDNTVSETIETNNTVSATVTVLPPAGDTTPPVVTSFSINDGAEMTAVPTVTLAVSAEDDVGGSGMGSIFFVEFEFVQAAMQWVPVQASGWLNYTTNYTWTLIPVAGVRYMQAWAADRAGNISLYPYKDRINYLLPGDQVAMGQVRLYRHHVGAGQTLTVIVIPISGDPDLYVWPPTEGAPAWVSNNGTGVDQLSIVATESGTYQVEVYGYSAAEYTISINVSGGRARLGGGEEAIQPVNADKPSRPEPVIPVSNEPPGRMAVPTAPVTGDVHKIYLPLIMRQAP